MDVFQQLRQAIADHDAWPDDDTRAHVVDMARRFVTAVHHHAQVIEMMRANCTPTEQALSELTGTAGDVR